MTDTQSLARRDDQSEKQKAIAELHQKFCDCLTGETGIVMTLERVWDAAIEAAARVAYNDGKCEYDNYEITEQIRELKKG